MAECLGSGLASTECLTFDMVESRLRWHDPQQQKQVTITIDDIVCILPKHQTQNAYTLLFLQRGHGSAGQDIHLESVQISSVPPLLLSQYECTEIPRHLQSSSSKRRMIHVIVSTVSGTGMAKEFCLHVLQPFLSQIESSIYDIHETKSEQTITELCRSHLIPYAEAGVPQTIILLSGDGGLTDIIDAFHNATEASLAPPTIALIPTGTGNAMASSLGLITHPKSGLTTLLQGKPQLIPTFAATFSPGAQYVTEEGRSRAHISNSLASDNQLPKIYGAVVASWGIHAALVADSDTVDYRRFGADRFKMAAKELLFPSNGEETHKYVGTVTLTKWNSQTKKLKVEIMDQREHMYLLATLVPRLEKDFVISPDSIALDGCLRLVHFGPTTPEQAMQLMTLAYQGGRHVSEEGVSYAEVEAIRIDFHEADEGWRRVCVDGKIVVVENGGWMEVRRERRELLNILVPAGLQEPI